MDKLPNSELDQTRERTARLAKEMGQLFVSCPNAEQTPEYEAWLSKYLQAQGEEQTLRV